MRKRMIAVDSAGSAEVVELAPPVEIPLKLKYQLGKTHKHARR
jgi:hypothetical protein